MHRARQGWRVQRARRYGEVAQQVDPPIRGRRPGELDRAGEGAQTFGRRGSDRRGSRRKSGLLHFEVLSTPSLPTRGVDRILAARVPFTLSEDLIVPGRSM